MHTSHDDAILQGRVRPREDNASTRSVSFQVWSHAADPHWMRANLPVVAEIAAALVAESLRFYAPHIAIRSGRDSGDGLPTATVTIWESREVCQQLGMPLAEVKVFMSGTSSGGLQGSSIKVECTHAEERTGAVGSALDRLVRVLQMERPAFAAYVRDFFDMRAKGIKRKG